MSEHLAALERFSAPTAEWFRAAFAEPTPAQAGAWEAIADGRHALVVAPTGSGKTLSAFLWAIDRLLTEGRLDKRDQPTPKGTRVLYISPLKALAVDVERNLRAPLTGIRQTADRLGSRLPDVTVGIRSGDTPAAERRTLARTPPDILITTPESLFLMLTSQARESLRQVETVIVDEVHAVAGTKRGTHLGLSLERLDALLPRPAQRIGLSATVRPLDEVARFLGGTSPVEVVAPPSMKEWDLKVVVPVEDMTQPGEYDEESDDDNRAGASIWPHVEAHVADLIGQHRSTIVFANSRRLAERLTRAAERDRRRASGGGGRRRRPAAGAADGAVGGVVRRGTGDREGPPRLGVEGAARPHRGRPEAWPPPLRRRHEQPRARHRHGRRRPRDPDRVAAQRRQCRSSAWAAPATRWARSAGACSFPSIAATWPRPPSPSSGCATG